MNKENTQKLFQDFPSLYRDARREFTTCMHDFHCGDGWFRLVYDLSSAIENVARIDGLTPDMPEWPRALQVKEKFGTLRFYISTAGDEIAPAKPVLEQRGEMLSLRPVASNRRIRELIAEAEKRSGGICEDCGLSGEFKNEGWVRVTCAPCEAKRVQSQLEFRKGDVK